MPGDIFYENLQTDLDNIDVLAYNQNKYYSKGADTFRIGFGRVSDEDIKKGIRVIGKNIHLLES